MRKQNVNNDVKETKKSNSKQNSKSRNSSRNNKSVRRNNYNASRTKTEDECNKDLKDSSNDQSWYTQIPELIADTARINFATVMGKTIGLGKSKPLATGQVLNMDYTAPGLLTLQVAPMYGFSRDNTSSLNQASHALYAWVRHANSKNSRYDAPDLMLYCMAMSEAYAYINYLQRVYGIICAYNVFNRYTPHALLMANGVEDSNFNVQSYQSEFRFGINRLINKLSTFAVPGDMPIFQRHAFMYKHVYTEGASPREQWYMFVPDGFHKYEEYQAAGKLTYVPFLNKKRTLPELIEFGNMLVDALMLSEDAGMMSGDIMAAYGSNLLKLAPLDENYTTQLLYDVPVLEQIRNATIIPCNNTTMDITQNPTNGALLSTPTTTNERVKTFGHTDQLINTVNPNPSPEYITEITRLKAGVRDDDTLVFCSEIVVAANIWNLLGGVPFKYPIHSQEVLSVRLDALSPDYGSDVVTDLSDLRRLCFRQAFDYAPQCFMYSFVDLQNIYNSEGTLLNDFTDYHEIGHPFNIDNYGLISTNRLDDLHEACIASMLVSPLIKKYN